jgi:diguanylate cyclase (GGDEF)-like protein
MVKATPDTADKKLLLDAAVENIPYGFCVWSPDFRLVMWNRRYLDCYGFSSEHIRRDMSLLELATYSASLASFDETPDQFVARYQEQLLEHRDGQRTKFREKLGTDRVMERSALFSPGLGWVITHEDVTDTVTRSDTIQRRKAELERQNYRLEAAVNNISQGLCMYDPQGRLVICNQPYQRIYGLPKQYLKPGTKLEDILAYLFDQGMSAGENRESYVQWRRDVISRGVYGKSVHELNGRIIMMQHHPMKDGGWVSTHEDVTEQRQTEARMHHLARHDALTDLPNRIQFLEEMGAMEMAIARGERAAVLWIDIDHFKAINDTLGHAMGDAVLKQVSARLWGTTRETDVLARLSGDEFSLLLKPLDGPREAAFVAERIVKAIGAPFTVAGQQIMIGASVGVALAPGDGTTADALMKNADLACYRAKSDGRSTYHFFEPGMDAALQRRRSIEAGLRTALAHNELRLAFQPLVGLPENRITCFEALLRWEHAERGAISPVEFIPVAEETGLIQPIGEWVLHEACRAAAGWPGEVRVAVNMSPVQFRNPRLFDTIQAAIAEARLSPNRLEIEITESLLLTDSDQTLETLHRLRDLGVRIALDDFGTGYSSLSYLRRFPFDKIKIDRSFMRDLARKGDSLAIIKAIIGLGHSLGMELVAEGVETEEQLNAVREQGCNEVQGFYFSPPMPPAAVRLLLETTGGRGIGPNLKPQPVRNNVTALRA